ncbi:MAG: hypothetical protein PHV06_04200 [bacterium]|nr:hypothetical protein [bacterium]
MEKLDSKDSQKKDFFIGFFLFIGFFFLYLNTISNDYYYDGVAFSMFTLEGFLGNLKKVFIGNHLFYCAFNLMFFKIFRILDPSVREFFTGQILDIILGCFGITFFYKLLRNLKQNIFLSISGAVVLGVSYVYWYFSVNIEYLIPAGFLIILILFFLQKELSLKNIIIISILHFLLVSMAIYHFMLAPIIVIVLFMKNEKTEKFLQRLKFPILYFIILVSTVTAAYLIVIFSVIKPVNSSEALSWFLGYAQPGADKYMHINFKSIKLSITAFINSVSGVYYPGTGKCLNILKIINTILLSAGGLVFIFNFKKLWIDYKTFILTVLGIFIIYGLFFSFWSPETPGFKIPQWIALIIIVILAVGSITNKILKNISFAGIILLILLVFTSSLKGSLGPGSNMNNNKPLAVTLELSKRTTIGDLFIISGYSPFPIFKVYLPYFGMRQVIAVSWYLDLNKRTHKDSISIIKEMINERFQKNNNVYVFADLIDDQASIDRLSKNKNISKEEINSIFEGYTFEEFINYDIYKIYKIE